MISQYLMYMISLLSIRSKEQSSSEQWQFVLQIVPPSKYNTMNVKIYYASQAMQFVYRKKGYKHLCLEC